MIIDVSSDPAAACVRFMASRLAAAQGEDQDATVAVSGGSTAPPLFSALADAEGLEWERVGVWQVDERVAPDGDDDRNAGQLDALPARLHPMPVTAGDLEDAAHAYASSLPDAFDVVHLGVGSDGHTASWTPSPHVDADRALNSPDAVLIVGEFNGRDRMTLSPGVVNAARCRVVLVTGEEKAPVIEAWVTGSDRRDAAWLDAELPVAALDPTDTFLFLDDAAASHLPASRFGDTPRRATFQGR